MLVKIDEAGRNDKSCCVDDASAREWLLANSDNLIAADADVADGIQGGFGIEGASAVNHYVVTSLGKRSSAKR